MIYIIKGIIFNLFFNWMPALSKKGSPLNATRRHHETVSLAGPSFRAPRTSTKLSFTQNVRPGPAANNEEIRQGPLSNNIASHGNDTLCVPRAASAGFVPASQPSEVIAPSPSSGNEVPESAERLPSAILTNSAKTDGGGLRSYAIDGTPSSNRLRTSDHIVNDSGVHSSKADGGSDDDILLCSSQQDTEADIVTRTRLRFSLPLAPETSAGSSVSGQKSVVTAQTPIPPTSLSSNPTPSPLPIVNGISNAASHVGNAPLSASKKRTLIGFSNPSPPAASTTTPPPQQPPEIGTSAHDDTVVEHAHTMLDDEEDDNPLPVPDDSQVSENEINRYLMGGMPQVITASAPIVSTGEGQCTTTTAPKRTVLSFGSTSHPAASAPPQSAPPPPQASPTSAVPMSTEATPALQVGSCVALKSPFRTKPKTLLVFGNKSAPPTSEAAQPSILSPLPGASTTSPETSNKLKPKRTMLFSGSTTTPAQAAPSLPMPENSNISPNTVGPSPIPTPSAITPTAVSTASFSPQPAAAEAKSIAAIPLYPLVNGVVRQKSTFQTKPSVLPSVFSPPPQSAGGGAATGRAVAVPSPLGGSSESPTTTAPVSYYGLPPVAGALYASRGVKTPYPWQEEVLNRQDVADGSNFVYSLPTSGGKTYVAEVLLMRALLKAMAGQQSQCSCLFVLPFVSLAEEKCNALQQFADLLKFNVEGYYGVQGRLPAATVPSIFVCTIEKANSLFNHLCDEGRCKFLKCVVVDELHMVGEPRRGPVLELLLTKIRLASPKAQIVGMSATVPNLKQIADWLGASCYIGTFRPVPLKEHVVSGGTIHERSKEDATQMVNPRQLGSVTDEHLQIMELLTEVPNCSTLVFCATRDQCLQYAKQIVRSLERMNARPRPECSNLLMDLKGGGQDSRHLTDLVPYGVAYHTGALSLEERDVVERGFKSRQITILCCTSTLAAGVNLPARRVIFKTPYVAREFLSKSMYTQMCGRAGRAGFDVFGESYLMLSKKDYQQGMRLVMEPLSPVHSGLFNERHGLARALMESLNVGVFATTANAKVWTRALLANFTNQPIPDRLLTDATQLVESSSLFPKESPPPPPSPLNRKASDGSSSARKGRRSTKGAEFTSPNPRASKRDRDGAPTTDIVDETIVAATSSSSLLGGSSTGAIPPHERTHTLASLSQHTPSRRRDGSAAAPERDPIDTLIEGSIVTLVSNGFLTVEALNPPAPTQQPAAPQAPTFDSSGLYGMLGLVGGGGPTVTNSDCPWAIQPAPQGPSGPKGLNISQPSDMPVNQYKLMLTPFGRASVKACFGIEEALLVRAEMITLQGSGIILTDDLQICYLVAPVMDPIECQWEYFNRTLCGLSDVRQRIAASVGLDMAFVHQRSTVGAFFVSTSSLAAAGGLGSSLVTSVDGSNSANLISDPMQRKLYVCRRYFASLVLSDLLNEVSSATIESRHGLNFSQQQALLRSSAIFSASMVAFCSTMEWFNVEALLAAFVKRLGFGVKPDIIPLMEINGVRSSKARVLYSAGYKTPALIAAATPQDLFKKVKDSNVKDNKAAKFFTLRSAVVVIREANVVLQRQLREKKGELEEMALRAKGR